MKTNKLLIFLAAMLLLNGCAFRDADPEKPDQSEFAETETVSASSGDTRDYKEVYKPVLDGFFKLASCGYDLSSEDFDDSVLPQGNMAILEGNGWGSSDNMLWNAGYTLRDLSGDGIPELVIGSVTDEAYEGYRTMIYALYTCADGQPQFVLEGAYRNAYYLMDDGAIFNQGSASAATSISAIYEFSESGQELLCRDYWFTYEKDGNYNDIRCWHNTVGEMNTDVSEELDMTFDEFWTMEEKLLEQAVVLDLTSFGEYGGVEKPIYAENPTLQAVYGSDYTGEYDSYSAEEGEYAVDVVFLTDGTVRDFKVLALTVTDVSEDGNVSFAFDDLYYYGELKQEKGLAVKMSLPETIPFYGISYTDGTGNTRIFSVNLSGFDGSVYLAEIGGVG